MAPIRSVLVVDADAAFAAALRRALAAAGHRCAIVSRGQEALDALGANRFDLMVTDMSLPDMQGPRLVECARNIAPAIPVIVTTADIAHFGYDSAMDAGASDFIAKPFSAAELLFRLRHVAHQEQLRVMSVTDDLTSLFNRRGFYTLTEQQLKMQRRQRQGMYMLYADVDGLKHINDTWGHEEGDAALIAVAKLLKGTYRESDIIARIGGDEFVVVPIGTTGDNMGAIIGRLLKKLDEHNSKGRRPYTLRLSTGTSYYDPANPCTIDELLSQGDRSMYADKKRKRG